MAPSGRYAQRLVLVDEDGRFVTETVPIMEGVVIAQGVEAVLGDTPADHLAFVVRVIRDHLRGEGCDHPGAGLFGPDCGQRVSEAG